MSRYEPVREIQSYIQILKSHVQLLIWIGEIHKKDQVAVEIVWRIKVDAVEIGCRYVKKWIPWFDCNENYQTCDSEEDENEAKEETEYGSAPHEQISPARSSLLKYESRSKLFRAKIKPVLLSSKWTNTSP